MTTLTTQQVLDEGLPDWRVLIRTLQTCFETGSFTAGADLVAKITTVAEQLNHHPDVLLRYPHVLVTTTSHDVGGLTERDVALARRISQVAAELGVPAAPAKVGTTEIAIDALDADAVRPFWQAVLGYERSAADETELADPTGRGPTIWFQQMDAPRPQRNRIHLDVWVPHDQAEARLQATLDAGGRLLSDEAAPSFWVLADPEGNEVCVCTNLGRAAG